MPNSETGLGKFPSRSVTYSLINLAIWLWWVLPLVRTPFDQINHWNLVAAIACVCFASPVTLALCWHWLRTSFLHKQLKMDHPTPRGWDHFVRNNHECWMLFHWKSGKLSGGYFGEHSYASTFPQEPEVYVEEMRPVDERGEFIEIVENSLGGVIRLSECERVKFLKVEVGGNADGMEEKGHERAAATADGGQAGKQTDEANGRAVVGEQQ